MNIGVTMKGLVEFQSKIKSSPVLVSNLAFNSMKVFTVKSKNDIQKLLNVAGRKDGASAPGEPPRKQTGHLLQSVYQKVERPSQMVIAGIIGDNADYAAFLEYGTSVMEPRPYFRKTVAENTKYFEDLMTSVLKQL